MNYLVQLTLLFAFLGGVGLAALMSAPGLPTFAFFAAVMALLLGCGSAIASACPK